MKSDHRNSWEKMFFKNNFSTPLTKEEAGLYEIPLEMLRLAPSATNAQPWRIVKDDNHIHFYEMHHAKSSEEEKLIKRVDLGIAMSHFHQTALEYGLNGTFEKLTQDQIVTQLNTQYIVSWLLIK